MQTIKLRFLFIIIAVLSVGCSGSQSIQSSTEEEYINRMVTVINSIGKTVTSPVEDLKTTDHALEILFHPSTNPAFNEMCYVLGVPQWSETKFHKGLAFRSRDGKLIIVKFKDESFTEYETQTYSAPNLDVSVPCDLSSSVKD